MPLGSVAPDRVDLVEGIEHPERDLAILGDVVVDPKSGRSRGFDLRLTALPNSVTTPMCTLRVKTQMRGSMDDEQRVPW